MKNIYYVYLLINKINKKMYVGQSINPEIRFIKGHCKNKKWPINKAIKKYGAYNFEMIFLFDTFSKEKVNEMEKYYIKIYNTFSGIGHGYNIHEGGTGGDTLRGANEERKKIKSEKIKFGNLGKKDTLETKEKKSLAHIGEKNSMYGKKHSEDSKRKNSESQLGEKHWRFVNFTKEEENLIKLNKTKNISIRQTVKDVNLFFNKKYGHKPISRFYNVCEINL